MCRRVWGIMCVLRSCEKQTWAFTWTPVSFTRIDHLGNSRSSLFAICWKAKLFQNASGIVSIISCMSIFCAFELSLYCSIRKFNVFLFLYMGFMVSLVLSVGVSRPRGLWAFQISLAKVAWRVLSISSLLAPYEPTEPYNVASRPLAPLALGSPIARLL